MLFDKLLKHRNGSPSDTDIEAKVKETLRNYGPLASTSPAIQIEVRNGVVILRGVVRGGGQRAMAGQLAATVDGVQAVQNELRDDPSLEGAIARELAIHPLLRLSTTRIRIKSFNGVVTLEGPVSNKLQQKRAETVTRSIPGVVNVINHLVVTPEKNGHNR